MQVRNPSRGVRQGVWNCAGQSSSWSCRGVPEPVTGAESGAPQIPQIRLIPGKGAHRRNLGGVKQNLGSKPLGAEGAPASPRICLTQGSSPKGLVAPGAVPSLQLHPSKASDVAWGDPLLPGTAQSLPLAANLLGLPANYPGISTWRRN